MLESAVPCLGIPHSTLLILTCSLRLTLGVIYSVNFPENLNRLSVSPRCTSILKFTTLFRVLFLCVCLSQKPMLYLRTGTVPYSFPYPEFQMQLLSVYIYFPEIPFQLVYPCVI